MDALDERIRSFDKDIEDLEEAKPEGYKKLIKEFKMYKSQKINTWGTLHVIMSKINED